MESLITYAQHIVQTLGPLGVFWASILEEIIVAIPSSLIQMSAGFFILAGAPLTIANVLKLATYVALPAAVGVFIGSLPIYFIAYYGGEPAIRRFGKWFMLKWEHIERAKEKLSKKKVSFWIITFFRFMPAMPSVVITAFCGVIRLSFWQFALSSLLGVFLRAFTMGAIGWFSNGLYERFAEKTSHLETIGLFIIATVVIVGLAILYAKGQKQRNRKKEGVGI